MVQHADLDVCSVYFLLFGLGDFLLFGLGTSYYLDLGHPIIWTCGQSIIDLYISGLGPNGDYIISYNFVSVLKYSHASEH